ncbi:MAG: helix-turn-helix domain containing protein [Paludibacter sp.]|nr:helix-turn-helix domain containing protein [Paludibacter sp.]
MAIEQDVMRAAGEMIEELGFMKVTLTGVAERAHIEPAVFYRRFANLDELFARYTKQYDYWLGNLANSIPQHLDPEETFKWILQNMVNALLANRGMQQLLVWELANTNDITKRTSQLRESVNEPLVKLLEETFKESQLEINTICSMLIASIYYLIIHKEISTFCLIDFTTEEGQKSLRIAIDQLVSMLFAHLYQKKEINQIAERLRNEGVSEDIIAKCIYLG